MSDIKATIFIPTYNGEKYLNEILKMIYKQIVDFKFDVLIIDSGSTDKTLSIIHKFQNKHDNLELIQIPNSEFGHGKTRNYAATISRGEYMVYLSHDAVPSDIDWLYEILKPFEINEKIVGVMGRQAPRPKCVPLQKYEILGAFKNLGPEFGTTIFFKDEFMKKSPVYYDPVTFYSDVNSAAKRSFLLETIPYRDVPYSEDQLFGRDLIDAGYQKAYASRATVIHSNDLELKEYKHRVFDEIIGLRKIGTQIPTPSKKAVLRMFVEGVLKDTYRTFKDQQYSTKRRIFWLIVNPLYHIEKWRGYLLGLKVELSDTARFDKFSLETRRQKNG